MDLPTLNALAITVCAIAGLLVFRWAAKKTDKETKALIEQDRARKASPTDGSHGSGDDTQDK